MASTIELKKVKAVCYHCGDDASAHEYTFDDHSFCCIGCQTVYQVLSDTHLKGYYKYNQHPGSPQKDHLSDITYLNDPGLVAKLVDYQDDEIGIITFFIPAIHCSSCIWLLEHLYKIDAAILKGEVDFLKKQVCITYRQADIDLHRVVELLRTIGYEPKITLQDVVKENRKFNHKDLVAKITVAGFCFGNSMMISFPEYFGMAEFERNYSNFFGYMNLAFGIPVLFYCASDYFKSAYFHLKNGHLNLDVPLALGILVLFVRSSLEILMQTGAGFMDTLCSLVFFILIGKLVQQKTYHHISFERDYRSYFPVAVTTLKEGVEVPVQIADLVVGDRIMIRSHEIVPADAMLLKGEASLDFSFVTGESHPVDKSLGEIVYAGGRQLGGMIELEVTKPVSQSYLTRLWNNETLKKRDKPFHTFVGFISKYFTLALLTAAVLTAIFWITQGNYEKAWNSSTAILIIACPCALALSSPFTLSAVLSIFDKNRFYVKSTEVVEQMARIETLVYDKTGTISSPNHNRLDFIGVLTEEERILINSVCRNSGHPLSREIITWLDENRVMGIADYSEISGKGQRAFYNEKEIKIGSARFLDVDDAVDEPESCVFVSIDRVFKGFFKFEQTWRSGLEDVVQEFNQIGIVQHVISGDNDKSASVLSRVFPKTSSIFFHQSPAEKMEKIELWKSVENRSVGMIGDGLNDAGALRAAHVGIAVSDDVNNFSPGCDAILDGRAFQLLPTFFAFCKDAVSVIKMSFFISIVYNIIGISFAMQGSMSPLFAAILMPISTVTIITFTSVVTRWFAKQRGLL